jgi:NTE family protein
MSLSVYAGHSSSEEQAMTNQSAETTEIGLVLQGGGALGAYEFGAITALLELLVAAKEQKRPCTLRVVTGVSIGAVNAACVVGAASLANAKERLAALWNELAIDTPPFVPPQIGRDLALWSVAHFYRLRTDFFAMPWWTYLYETNPLLDTLSAHVSFEDLNANPIAFVITAVDVECGKLVWFANQQVGVVAPTKIEPHHVLASGSLAPQFPCTEIKDRAKPHYYWDGGIVDNTPLGAAIDAFSASDDVKRVLVVMNLFPAKSKLPTSPAQVNDRVNQLRFGNRLHQDRKNAELVNSLIQTIEGLVQYLPSGIPPPLQGAVAEARKLKSVRTIELTLGPHDALSDVDGFRDFSRGGIETRYKVGYDIAKNSLQSICN